MVQHGYKDASSSMNVSVQSHLVFLSGTVRLVHRPSIYSIVDLAVQKSKWIIGLRAKISSKRPKTGISCQSVA